MTTCYIILSTRKCNVMTMSISTMQIFMETKLHNKGHAINRIIAQDKAAYCVFTQFREPENSIKFISVRTKTQWKSLILNSELFRSVWRYSIQFAIVVFCITSCCWLQIYTQRCTESGLWNCKPGTFLSLFSYTQYLHNYDIRLTLQ